MAFSGKKIFPIQRTAEEKISRQIELEKSELLLYKQHLNGVFRRHS